MRRFRLLSVAYLLLMLMAACGKDDEAVDPNAPLACFNIPQGEVYAGVGVGFSSACSKNAVTYLWEFSDGGVSTEENPVHTFKQEGTYTVELTVEDAQGAKHAIRVTVKVLASPFIEHSGYIDQAEVWEEGYHLVKGNVYIRNGSLTIKPGAKVYLNKQRSIFVGHRETTNPEGALLTANGTAEKPIVFLPSSGLQLPGEWGHIFITEKASPASSLQYCDVQYGGKANSDWDYEPWTYYTHYGLVHVNKSGVRIENTRILGAANYAVALKEESYFTSFINNTLVQNANYPIYIHLNYVHTIGKSNVIESDKGILVHGMYYEQPDAIWYKHNVPYVLEGEKKFGSSLADPYKLRIEAGTTISLAKGASLSGLLLAEGTATNPIVFTSAEPVKAKGDWIAVRLAEGSVLSYCHFEYGGGENFYSVKQMVSSPKNTSISHCTFRESLGIGLEHKGFSASTVLANNTFVNCAGFGLSIPSDTYHLLDNSNTFTNAKGLVVDGYSGILADVTWEKRPFDVYLSGTLYISGSQEKTLTLAPGTKFYFTPGSSIRVGWDKWIPGGLIADGTSERIIFTLSQEDKEAGHHWGRILFTEGTMAVSKLVNCEISYGGSDYANQNGAIHCSFTSNTPLIKDNLISNSAGYGISKTYATPVISGNIFRDNAMADIHDF